MLCYAISCLPPLTLLLLCLIILPLRCLIYFRHATPLRRHAAFTLPAAAAELR